MTEFNLADFYRTANLAPGNETVSLRIEPIEKAASDLSGSHAIDLARYYFGLPGAIHATWLPDLFRESDASFSLIDNEREAAVLAAAILAVSIGAGSIKAVLAVLAASAGGLRTPVECPQVLEQARREVLSLSIKSRRTALPNLQSLKPPTKTKAGTNGAAAAETQDWQKLGESLKQIADESTKSVDALASQTLAELVPLSTAIKELREEVSILWWHVGGWSRELEKPFAEFSSETAAVLAGFDIAEMSISLYAPASSIVLLEKTIHLGRDQVATEATFDSLITGLSADELGRLKLREVTSSVFDVCPIHAAIAKSNEIGTGAAWHQIFEKLTGLAPAATLTAHSFGVQALRERLLTYCL